MESSFGIVAEGALRTDLFDFLFEQHSERDREVILDSDLLRLSGVPATIIVTLPRSLASFACRAPDGPVIGFIVVFGDDVRSWTSEQIADLSGLADAIRTPPRTDEAERETVTVAREVLQRNEDRFRALIENAMDLVAVVTPGGTIDYITPSVERLLGRSAASLIGSNAFGLLHPEDAPEVIARFSGVLRGACQGEAEFRLRTDSPGRRPSRVAARNMMCDDSIGGVVINARDVTDERQAMQMRRQLDAFLEATPDFIATFDPHGRALSMNRAFRTLLAIDRPDSVAGLTIADLFPPGITERLLNEGIPHANRTGSWSGETFVQGKTGEEIPVSQVILAHRSQDGALEFISTLARDITAQKEAASALSRSEAHFRSLIENALDIISIVDVEGKLLFVSPSIQRGLGWTPEELLGRSVFSLVHEEEIPIAAEAFSRVVHKGELVDPSEFRIRHKSGGFRRLEHVSENLLGDPAVGGIVLNSRDVTDRRQAEEALIESQQQLLQAQKMEAVGRLAGGIAHDFNNLLTAIKGFTGLLLLDFEQRDPRRSYVAEIQGAATRAASLTRQLLAFSRRQVLQPEVLDLNATVSEMEKMLRRLVGEDLRMTTSLDPELGRVRADPGQIEQVVMNLVVNARDAMPQGGALEIRTSNAALTERDSQTHAYVQPGNFILLEVSDTGVGMSRELQDRVFEPFFTTKEQGKGTGLGLSTVYGIVKQSGGYVWVESEPGRGTTFRIYLPRVEGMVSARSGERPDAGMALEGNETILLVEDELSVRVLVRRVLDRMGYHVVDASSGAEVLELVRNGSIRPDLLLTDVVMPGMSGRKLSDSLQAARPGLKVLYMSGYTDEAIGHHGVLEPGVSFLEKPFTPDALLRCIREMLDADEPVSEPDSSP